MRTRFLELPGFQPDALFFATRMALSVLLAYYVALHPAPQPRRPVDALLLARAEELLASHEHALAASPGALGLASVDPVFTWVRLAQRIPVRIHIDQVPATIHLALGMTATVTVGKGAGPASPRGLLSRVFTQAP